MVPDHPAMLRALLLAKQIAAKAEPGFAGVSIPVPGEPIPLVRADGGQVDDTNNLNDMGLYSQAAKAANTLKQAKGLPQDMLRAVSTAPGVKKDELHWSGAQDKFAGQSGIAKDDLAQHFQDNMPNIKETTLGHKPPSADNDWSTTGGPRYENQTIPGGNNYREVLMHLPQKQKSFSNILKEKGFTEPLTIQQRFIVQNADRGREADYNSSHWDTPNVLAHLRMSDRDTPEGEKALHLEELQSDWGQNARKYGTLSHSEIADRKNAERAVVVSRSKFKQREKELSNAMHSHDDMSHPDVQQAAQAYHEAKQAFNEADDHAERFAAMGRTVPEGPYINKTENWTDLGLKRALIEAARGGHDKLVYTPGDEQAKRYNIGQSIGYLEAHPKDPDKKTLRLVTVSPDDEEILFDSEIHSHELDEHVGRDIADKIRSQISWPKTVNRHQVYNLSSLHGGSGHDTEEEAHAAINQYPENMRKDLGVRPVTERALGKSVQLSGLDLRSGNEGMTGYYDKLLPQRLIKLAREHDPEAQLDHHVVEGSNKGEHITLPGLTITPRMREGILKRGFKAFADGGEVEPIKAYHGGPNDFDEFSTGHSGTGYGGSAFGHGLNFAEDEGVAKTYRNRAAKAKGQLSFVNKNGDVLPENHPATKLLRGFYKTYDGAPNRSDIEDRIGNWRWHGGKDSDDAIADYTDAVNNETNPEYKSYLQKSLNEIHENKRALLGGADALEQGYRGRPHGHMYEVELNADPNKMIHWHEPLEKQPENVRRMADEINEKTKDSHPAWHLDAKSKGSDIYHTVKILDEHQMPDTNRLHLDPSSTEIDYDAINRFFDKHDVHGIKWKAGDSQIAPSWDTHNYTVQDPKRVKINRKYALGGEVEPTTYADGGAVNPNLQNGAIDGDGDDKFPETGSIYNTPDSYAGGGLVMDKQKAIRRALMTATALHRADGGETEPKKYNLINNGQRTAPISETSNPLRIKFDAQGPGGVKGIIVPRHMWEGGNGKNGRIAGMNEVNDARADVYGSEPRAPLNVGQIEKAHKDALEEHFNKPVSQQISDEKAALARLRAARHIGKTANTLDEGEKLDTVKHEYDDQGRSYVAYGAKGTAGHAVYSSGAGDDQKIHVLNTCPGQTSGCGGGVDKNGIVDTRRGMCFAPKAEAQYVGAAVRRASHTQAKHDPAMTKDWILAHTGSLRDAAKKADKTNNVVLFRPNVLDETDRSTRYAIKGLNSQRKESSLPPMIANSYGKTTELHDPENGYYITHSNIGPKTKLGASISENIKRDRQRIRSTITAADAGGKDFVNDEGRKTPPKNSYMVTDVARDSLTDAALQKSITHAKYWSTGRDHSELSPSERTEGPEGHFDGEGKQTTADKAHYGHATLNGLRYDYQKQHILHPRYVKVGKNDDGSDHMIPTDSRFKDDDFLPKDRFKTKNGKKAGAIVLTTPTKSTSGIERQASFTHHVGQDHIKHAVENNGEYEIDPPHQQEAARGNEYKPPVNPAGKYARGGSVHRHDDEFDTTAFPSQSFEVQLHNAHKGLNEENEADEKRGYKKNKSPMEQDIVQRALRVTQQIKKPSRT